MKQTDFYAEADIQPFKRDLSDKAKYFEQRDLLLRHLGVVPRMLRGANILEFGPGHGENALYLLIQDPAKLVLVELSDECITEAEKLLEPNKSPQTVTEYHHMSIDDYPVSDNFDLVVFEGVIPFEPDPPALLKQTAQYVAEGGVMCITCIDPVSLFSEALRRLIGDLAAPMDQDMDTRVQALLPIFKPHLETMAGMTRRHDHWVIDQMIHPWSGNPLSILDAAKTLSGAFRLHGSSPHFMSDWRWFRNTGDDAYALNLTETQYYANVHNLMDYRFSRPERSSEANKKVVEFCTNVLQAVKDFEATNNRDVIKAVPGWVSDIADNMAEDAPETAQSLQDYLKVLNSFMSGGTETDFASFASMFGRGQQYVSFIRNKQLG